MASDFDINRQERGNSIPISHVHNSVQNEFAPVPLSLTDLQASMEKELEKRKSEWEKDVSFMKSDFFNRPRNVSVTDQTLSVPNSSREIELRASPSPINSLHNSTSNLSDETNGYYNCPDGTKLYRLQFDLHEYEPQDISVKMEGSNLCISANHENSGTNFRNSAQFNKSILVPDNVDIDNFTARLSSEGLLTIKAGVNSESLPIANYEHNSLFHIPLTKNTNIQTVNYPKTNLNNYWNSQYDSDPSTRDYHIRKHTVLPITHTHSFAPDISHSFPLSSRQTRGQHPVYVPPRDFNRNNWRQRDCYSLEPTTVTPSITTSTVKYRAPLVVICGEQRKMKITVPVDSSFSANQIEITFDGANIGVYIDGTLLKQYECPETIKFSALRAYLTTDGRILIAASCASNVDHDSIITSIERDLPMDAQPCRIRLLYHGVSNEINLD